MHQWQQLQWQWVQQQKHWTHRHCRSLVRFLPPHFTNQEWRKHSWAGNVIQFKTKSCQHCCRAARFNSPRGWGFFLGRFCMFFGFFLHLGIGELAALTWPRVWMWAWPCQGIVWQRIDGWMLWCVCGLSVTLLPLLFFLPVEELCLELSRAIEAGDAHAASQHASALAWQKAALTVQLSEKNYADGEIKWEMKTCWRLLWWTRAHGDVSVAVYALWWRTSPRLPASQLKSFLTWLWLLSNSRSGKLSVRQWMTGGLQVFLHWLPLSSRRFFSSTVSILASNAGWSVSVCALSQGRWPPMVCRRMAIRRTCTWSLPDKPASPASCSSRTWKAPSWPRPSHQAMALPPKNGGVTALCPQG